MRLFMSGYFISSLVFGTLGSCPLLADDLVGVGSSTSWPAAWTALSFSSTSEAADGVSPAALDFVGDVAHPVAYWASDDTGIYFRIRINSAAALTSGTIPNGTLMVMLDTDGLAGPDYAFAWDAVNNANVLKHGLEMSRLGTSTGTWDGTKFADVDGAYADKTAADINGLVSGTTYRTGDGFVRSSVAADGLGSFVDIKVTWSYLTTYSTTGLAPGQSWKVNFGSISGAGASGNDHQNLNGDVVGSLTDSATADSSWSATITPVPEPSPLGFAALGTAGTVAFIARRRRAGSR